MFNTKLLVFDCVINVFAIVNITIRFTEGMTDENK